jgi:hypothetical protein
MLDDAFEQLPAAVTQGAGRRSSPGGPGRGSRDPGGSGAWSGRETLAPVLLGEDAGAIVQSLLAAVREGAAFDEIAGAVAYAAALRIAQFPTSNEFGDWDTALHTFTFANAVHQGLRRAPSVELLRGVFDAAAGVYLDRFLNVPPVRLPSRGEFDPAGPLTRDAAGGLLSDLGVLLDRQQQVGEAGHVTAQYLYRGGDPAPLIAALGRLLLREDRNFHTIQMVEAAVRQFSLLRGASESAAGVAPAAVNVLVAATRYLAAHAPTVRAQGQTFRIAQRLHRGEHLFEDA